jgi:outer membrane immunogenic protein
MRRFASMLMATSSLVAFAVEAHAADIPSPMATKAPVVAPMRPAWTGCYLGGHGGWGWGRKDVADGVLVPGFEIFQGFDDHIDGFLGGVQGGCNYQFAPNWLVGVEGDWSWSDIKGDFSRDPFFSGKGSNTGTFSVRTTWVATLAGRVGYTWERWMLYGKAGAAWAHDNYNLIGQEAQPFSANGSETRGGWVVGAGVEYAFWNNWSAKLEYDFMDFGNRSVGLTNIFRGDSSSVSIDVDQRIQVLKFGINYRFVPGPSAPAEQ